ncbi:MAG TPA: hypothetical protein VGM97_05760 [Steroidobacteraceae bacterium]|jgi:hypothetical protein
MSRPYLAFVRAGNKSTHQRLLAENPDRNWDCCVSWYVPRPAEKLAEHYCEGGFNKFGGFLEFWKQRPNPWPWRYVALIDDDVYLRPGDLSRLFELSDRNGTYLSQPALNWFTYTTINVLVRNPVCVMRRVNFIEAMAPCFSMAALEQLVHTFDWSRSTWGIDVSWAYLSRDKQPLHVLDAVSMDHTRMGDGRSTALYRELAAMGVSPAQELQSVLDRFPEKLGHYRMLKAGHVFRPGIPPLLAPVLMRLFEKLKIIVRMRKQLLRTVRNWRYRLGARFAS